MGGIVSCGKAATTTLCTLWTFVILFHNPSIKPAAAGSILHSRTLCIMPILLYNGLRI